MVGSYRDFTGQRRTTLATYGESAHAVKLVRLAWTKDPNRYTEWYEKHLESMQEAQVECMTGAIYRYLIGPSIQPRIRLSARDTVESESVKFHSFRDLFEKNEVTLHYKKYGKALRKNLGSLAMVLFSSIVFEENDLSANNYGLSYTGNGSPPSYGQFVKIDHGQSLNPMRISEERWSGRSKKSPFLNLAEIKYFKPDDDRRGTGSDLRKKSDRTTLRSAGYRSYELSYEFFDRINMDFVDGAIDESYIKGLKYQPSIMPFYDARMLPLLDAIDDDRSRVVRKLEYHRYKALTLMAMTTDSAYRHLALNATDPNDLQARSAQTAIVNRIIQQVKSLRKCLDQDPDWRRFCSRCSNKVTQMAQENWRGMVYRSNGNVSQRYANGPGSPFDGAALAAAAEIGKDFDKTEVLDLTEDLIKKLLLAIEAKNDWKLGKGGVEITLTDGNTRKVSHTIASIHRHLKFARRDGALFYRAVRAATEAIKHACDHDRWRRDSNTTAFYKQLWKMIRAYGLDLRQHLSRSKIKVIHPALELPGVKWKNPYQRGKKIQNNPLHNTQPVVNNNQQARPLRYNQRQIN